MFLFYILPHRQYELFYLQGFLVRQHYLILSNLHHSIELHPVTKINVHVCFNFILMFVYFIFMFVFILIYYCNWFIGLENSIEESFLLSLFLLLFNDFFIFFHQ